LKDQGILAKDVGFNALTIPSDRFICARQQTEPNQSQFIVLDLASPMQKIPLICPTLTESAIMNPVIKVIAIKEGQKLQTFDLEMKICLKTIFLQEYTTFWKWISVNVIALVTQTKVYHWSMEGNTQLNEIHARHQALNGYQIINYHVDHTKKWSLLIGIRVQNHRVLGVLQLYNTETKISQLIEGHVAAFASVKLGDNYEPSNLLIIGTRRLKGGTLRILEIGDPPLNNEPFQEQTLELLFPSEIQNDFPVCLQINEKHGLIYLITKYSYLHVCTIESMQCIYMGKLSNANTFAATLDTSSHGILSVDDNGQVFSTSMNTENIVPYIINTLQNKALARKVALRCNLSGAEDLFIEEFNQLFDSGEYVAAAKIAVSAPKGVLRTSQTIQRFQQHIPRTTTALAIYFDVLLRQGKLNRYESLELSKRLIHTGKNQALEHWLKQAKLENSEELGDLLRSSNPVTASSIYLAIQKPKKVIINALFRLIIAIIRK
ncbi:uncharacterized protein TRIADDRAFT_18730, partial [Trichoplax adhaerens]